MPTVPAPLVPQSPLSPYLYPLFPSVPVPTDTQVRTPSAAVAQAASAVAAATASQATAQTEFDSARLDLAGALADQDAATARAAEAQIRADAAADQAEESNRVLASLVRSMVQRGAESATLDAMLGDQGTTDLLARLGIVDRIANLTGSISEIRDLVQRDTERAARLETEDVAAHEVAQSIPVDEKRTALTEAETTLTETTTALATATEEAESALASSSVSTPIVDRSAGLTSQLAGMIGARISDRGWATPAVGIVTDGFGPRPELPLPGVQPFHSGTDVGSACGTPVYAATDGVIIQTGSLGTYGNWIQIDHGGGIATGYAHLRDGSTLVNVGDTVVAGQVIAGVGSTGASTGCHLHVEVRINGSPVDAYAFLAQVGIQLGAG